MKTPACPHSEHITVLCERGPHYSKRVCRRCQRVLGFVDIVRTPERRKELLARVNELWNTALLPYQRALLQAIADADGHMDPKQEARLNGMWARYCVDRELAGWPKKSS